MAIDPVNDPRAAGNSRITGSVADIDSTQDFEDLDGDIDMTDRGENPGDSGGAANDGGDPEDESGLEDEDFAPREDSEDGALNSAPAQSSFGVDPNDAFDSEAPTG